MNETESPKPTIGQIQAAVLSNSQGIPCDGQNREFACPTCRAREAPRGSDVAKNLVLNMLTRCATQVGTIAILYDALALGVSIGIKSQQLAIEESERIRINEAAGWTWKCGGCGKDIRVIGVCCSSLAHKALGRLNPYCVDCCPHNRTDEDRQRAWEGVRTQNLVREEDLSNG